MPTKYTIQYNTKTVPATVALECAAYSRNDGNASARVPRGRAKSTAT